MMKHFRRFDPDDLADRVTSFSGSWPFVLLHAAWFFLWLIRHWDINLLTLIVSLEAIFLATFVLMSGNRTQARTDALMEKILKVESTLDEHVNITAKQHADDLADNTKLTKTVHALVSDVRDMISEWKSPMDKMIARAVRPHKKSITVNAPTEPMKIELTTDATE